MKFIAFLIGVLAWQVFTAVADTVSDRITVTVRGDGPGEIGDRHVLRWQMKSERCLSSFLESDNWAAFYKSSSLSSAIFIKERSSPILRGLLA